MSHGEALCNQRACLITEDQTLAPWQPLPHFPKQRSTRYSACRISVTRCYAWLTLGRLPEAQYLFQSMAAQQLHGVIPREIVGK